MQHDFDIHVRYTAVNNNPPVIDVPASIELHGRANAMQSHMAEFDARAAYRQQRPAKLD